MVLDGYDHISDIVDADGSSIAKVARSRGHQELASFLDDLRVFEVRTPKVCASFNSVTIAIFRNTVKNSSTLSDKMTSVR
jgi:hypothetical protein